MLNLYKAPLLFIIGVKFVQSTSLTYVRGELVEYYDEIQSQYTPGHDMART